ncbi:Ig domain-containing protein [Serratia odorifera]|uniref:Ig domain-containing protein n=1 Tax=Serratia odorifera TaxID=618 RepID=UPI0018E8A79B|nr:Ig domain-containing protein [Serratia odorifera]MBJ2068112.1 hypothetical protein [Serratia odorifera]
MSRESPAFPEPQSGDNLSLKLSSLNEDRCIKASDQEIILKILIQQEETHKKCINHHDKQHIHRHEGEERAIYPNVISPGRVGHLYGSYEFQVTEGKPPYRFEITDGHLPESLELSQSGVLSGMLHEDGTFNFRLTAKDVDGLLTHQDYMLFVMPPDIAIYPEALPVGTVDKDYTPLTLVATGGVSPYSFEIKQGTLPSDLTLKDTGELMGTLYHAGLFPFTARVTDAKGYSTERDYTLFVSKTDAPQLILEPSTIQVTLGDLPQNLSVTGGNRAPLSFVSANDRVVTVSDNGLLTFTGVGSTSVMVRQEETDSYFAPQPNFTRIEVRKALPELKVSIKESMHAGESQWIEVTSSSDGEIIYHTDSDLFSITQQGKLTAKSAGSGMVTISLLESAGFSAQSASYPVTVQKNAAIQLSADPVSVTYGDGNQVIRVSGGNCSQLFYKSNNEELFTIDDLGILTFNAAGSGTVTVSQQATDDYFSPNPIEVAVTVNVAKAKIEGELRYGGMLTADVANLGLALDDIKIEWRTNNSSGPDTFPGGVAFYPLVSRFDIGLQVFLTVTSRKNSKISSTTITPGVVQKADTSLVAEQSDIILTFGTQGINKIPVTSNSSGNITYHSDDLDVVSFEQDGTLIIYGAGYTKIKVEQAETSTHSAPPPITIKITVNIKSPSVPSGWQGPLNMRSQVYINLNNLGLKLSDCQLFLCSDKDYYYDATRLINPTGNGDVKYVLPPASAGKLIGSHLYFKVKSKKFPNLPTVTSAQTPAVRRRIAINQYFQRWDRVGVSTAWRYWLQAWVTDLDTRENVSGIQVRFEYTLLEEQSYMDRTTQMDGTTPKNLIIGGGGKEWFQIWICDNRVVDQDDNPPKAPGNSIQFLGDEGWHNSPASTNMGRVVYFDETQKG